MARAQSAFEYLSTYSWAIFAAVVVVGIMFALGIFSSPIPVQSCILVPGYVCSHPIMSNIGLLTFNLSYVGQTITVTGIGCNSGNQPPASLQSTSFVLTSNKGATITVACPISSNAFGTAFQGHLWLQYNTQTQSNLVSDIGVILSAVNTQTSTSTTSTSTTSSTSTSTTTSTTSSTSSSSTSSSTSTSTSSSSTSTTTVAPPSLPSYSSVCGVYVCYLSGYGQSSPENTLAADGNYGYIYVSSSNGDSGHSFYVESDWTWDFGSVIPSTFTVTSYSSISVYVCASDYYALYASPDGSTWTQFAQVSSSDGSAGSPVTHSISGSYRYIKAATVVSSGGNENSCSVSLYVDAVT